MLAVSAIEPLFEKKDAAPCVVKWVDLALRGLEQVTAMTPDEIKLLNDFRSRIGGNKTESKKAAVRRIVAEAFPGDEETVDFADDAYDLRSQIVHDGKRPPGLEAAHRRFTEIMRRVYSLRLGFGTSS